MVVMSVLKLLIVAALAVGNCNTFATHVSAQTTTGDSFVPEPSDFNITTALLGHGIPAADMARLSELANTLTPPTTTASCSVACDALKHLYGDEVVETRDETAYTDFVNSYCGGHAAMARASSAPKGITVSFMNMKAIKLSEDRSVASIQPGNIWGDVYKELAKSDVTVIGGRLYNIGVGGLTTGGGISYFTNQYGWACDNVESYDLVTSTGAIIHVSSTQHPDLFWALRGGGNNFGLVVNFHLRTVPLPGGRMWGGSRTYTDEGHFPQLNEAFHNIIVNSSIDDKAGLWHTWVYVNHTLISQPTLYYGEPDAGNASIFADFNAIPPDADDTQNQVLPDFAGSENALSGLHEVYFTLSTKASLDFLNWLTTDLYAQSVIAVADIPGILPTLTIQGITAPQLAKMQQNGGNALGRLDPEDGPFYLMIMAIMWSNEEDSKAVYGFASDLLQQASNEARKRGLYNEFLYMNYASQFQDVIGSYGRENKARLKRISNKYDPTGVFQTLQPGYFKLDGAPVRDSGYFSF